MWHHIFEGYSTYCVWHTHKHAFANVWFYSLLGVTNLWSVGLRSRVQLTHSQRNQGSLNVGHLTWAQSPAEPQRNLLWLDSVSWVTRFRSGYEWCIKQSLRNSIFLTSFLLKVHAHVGRSVGNWPQTYICRCHNYCTISFLCLPIVHDCLQLMVSFACCSDWFNRLPVPSRLQTIVYIVVRPRDDRKKLVANCAAPPHTPLIVSQSWMCARTLKLTYLAMFVIHQLMHTIKM